MSAYSASYMANRLPVRPDDACQRPAATILFQETNGKPRALVADGDPELADLLRIFLVHEGYDVDIATSSLDCLELMRRKLPQVIVLDHQLPPDGGEQILARICSQAQSERPSVVLTSDENESPTEMREPQVSACLQKPFRMVEFLKCVAAVSPTRLHFGATLNDN